MTDKVFYEELLPDEFIERLENKPVGYLPLGTIEWHGMQNGLGADLIQSRGLFRLAAERFGGIVFPSLWIGPDRITTLENGLTLIGMDTADETNPHQQLPGSCYWISKGVFISVLEAIIIQAKRVGFKCILADGHGPSRNVWNEMIDGWEKQYNIKLLSAIRDFPNDTWKTQNDHAGKNETSIMMAIRPDLVDLNKLPNDEKIWPKGIAGEDPRYSTSNYGKQLIEQTLKEIGEKIEGIE
jgi:creatinine amidohydrolase